jgi:hypothetical protein
MYCMHKSEPHNLNRLKVIPTIRQMPTILVPASYFMVVPAKAAMHAICHIMSHKPALTGPIFRINIGAAQVLASSASTDATLMTSYLLC